MDSESLLEALELDREEVAATAGGMEDYARRYGELGDIEEILPDLPPDARMLLLSSAFAFAASLRALLDPSMSLSGFRRAAAQQREIGQPYGLLLGICGSPREPNWEPPPEADPPALAHATPHAQLLGIVWPAAATGSNLEAIGSQLDRLSASSIQWSTRPAGRMRIPLGHYLDLCSAIVRVRADPSIGASEVASTAARYLRRAGEASSAARADSYHWRRLGSGLLPMEPEALATAVLAEMTFRDTTGEPLSTGFDAYGLEVPYVDKAPLLVAQEIAGRPMDSTDRGIDA